MLCETFGEWSQLTASGGYKIERVPLAVSAPIAWVALVAGSDCAVGRARRPAI